MSMTSKVIKKIRAYRFITLLDKMIVSSLIKTLLAVLAVIVVIIISRKFIKVLVQAIEGNIANETILSILGLNMIIAVNAFLPVAIFMAILMVLGRMYADNEMAAIASAGGGWLVIYRAVFLLVLPLSIVTAGISMIATPWAEAKIKSLVHDDRQTSGIRGITPGRFSEYRHGNLVLYTEEIDSDQRMRNVFVQYGSGESLAVVNAKYGAIKNLPAGNYLVLEQGEQIKGVPGAMDFVIEQFDKQAVLIANKSTTLRQKRDAIASHVLWRSKKLKDVVEIQKRLSVPSAVLFLSLLAVPLARIPLRATMYKNLAIAFAVYFIFGNLRRVSHSWIISKTIPVWVGYYWIYGLLFLLGSALLIHFYSHQGIRIKK